MMEVMKITEEKIEEVLGNYNYSFKNTGDITETVLNIFVGTTGTTRLGPVPGEETKNEIRKRVRIKINNGEPFEVSCAWGAIKSLPTKETGVDIAELLAFWQYQAINRQIKQVYEPGVKFNLYLGDSYYEYLYGPRDGMISYCDSIEELAQSFEEVNVIRISNRAKKIKNASDICESNYKLLKDYWMDTLTVPEERFKEVPTYKKLRDAGWVGTIPLRMRDFYKKRMKSNYRDKDDVYWTEKILRFFAYGMFISQNDLMGRKCSDTSTVDSCLLRVPPPGLPRTLYSNRIRMRIAPENTLKNSAPPWTVKGAVSVSSEGKTHIRIVDSSLIGQIFMEHGDYRGIPYGIIDEYKYPWIYGNIINERRPY